MTCLNSCEIETAKAVLKTYFFARFLIVLSLSDCLSLRLSCLAVFTVIMAANGGFLDVEELWHLSSYSGRGKGENGKLDSAHHHSNTDSR